MAERWKPARGLVALSLAVIVAIAGCAPTATPSTPAPRTSAIPSPTALPAATAIGPTAPAETPTPAATEPARPTPESAATPQPSGQPSQTLDAILSAAAARYQGQLGVIVKRLGAGESASLNANQRFRSASLYKLFVLYSAFSRLQSGELSRDEVLTFSKAAFDAEPYAEWTAGSTTTVSCALQTMITLSNNAASEMLLERLGGGARVTADMRAIGLEQSQIGPDYAYTSPADVARLLELVATKQAISPASSDAMLALMLDQTRNDRLPLPLPFGVKVAHKTGELTKLRNDAGIVFAPSGPYLFVALASDAPNDAAARQAVLDLARDVYGHFEPGGLATYYGLPPRLAQQVFALPDAQGRLAPLDDQWGETVSVSKAGVTVAQGADSVQVREMVVPDLLQMQQAASSAGSDFWVEGGFRAPRAADGPKVDSSATALPCKVTIAPPPTPTPGPPKPKSTPGPTPTPVKVPFTMELPPAPAASQQWLGTTVVLSDTPDGNPTGPDYGGSAAGQWLLAHAWEYGFVLAPAESPAGQKLGYEPWKLRWVGREMANHLHTLGYESNPTTVVRAQLAQAERALVDQATQAAAASR